MHAIEKRCVFILRPMAALVHHDKPAALYHVRDLRAFLWSGCRVVRGPDNQSRFLNTAILGFGDHVAATDFHLLKAHNSSH